MINLHGWWIHLRFGRSETHYIDKCPRCQGVGHSPGRRWSGGIRVGSNRIRCWLCKGAGEIVRQIGGWP